MNKEIQTIIDTIVEGNKRVIAKAITMVESEKDGYLNLLDQLHFYTGKSLRVGITGPPGAGKSTFTNHLIKLIRARRKTVGVIAVDPSSPFSGGAILGDRIRMKDVLLDDGVFIRSMAARGNLGGLARQSMDAAEILEAAGSDIIIFETVGVGQIELDIMSAVDTIVLMTVPDAGDVIQTMKAGIMEIGDIFVVNKSDLAGADRMRDDIDYMLNLRSKKDGWRPKVRLSEAIRGIGIEVVLDDIFNHISFLEDNNLLIEKRKQRLKNKIIGLINYRITEKYWDEEKERYLNSYLNNEIKNKSPYKFVDELFKDA